MMIKKYYWLFALILIFALALYIRVLPGYKMSYPRLQSEADCYLTYRMGMEILENGKLPEKDEYAAYGTYLTGFNRLDDYILDYYTYPVFYWILNPIFGVSFYWVGVWIPAFLGALQVFLLYFVVKELFNDKRIAVVSSAVAAVIPGVLYRVSAGWMDKEPMAGVFMLIGLFFFFRGLKEKEMKNSWTSKILIKLRIVHAEKQDWKIIRMVFCGLLAGFFFYLMNGVWGGVRFVLVLIASFIGLSLIINKYSKNMIYVYVPTFIFYFLISRTLGNVAPRLRDIEILANFIVTGLILLRFSIEKFNIVKKERMPFLIPGLIIIGFFAFLLLTYIDVELGIWFNNLIERVQKPLSADVIGSTVAESQTAAGFFSDAPIQFGTGYAISSLKLPDIFKWFSVFYLALLGFLIMLIHTIHVYLKSKKLEIGYEYLFSFTFFILGVMASIGAVRLSYFLSFPVAFISAYFIVKGYDYFIKYGAKLKIHKSYLNAIAIVIIFFILGMHSASAYIVGNSIGPGVEEGWLQSFFWIKNNTDKKDTVLEWWDYGYWFQLFAERRTMTDGGFHTPDPLIKVAKFYTEPLSNESLIFLKNYSVDYVMVSPDLIGKFGALSKIANWGSKVDILPVFYLTNRYQQGDKIMMEYSIGDQQILIAFSMITDNETTSISNITAVYRYGRNQAYIRDIAFGNKIIRMQRSDVIPGMVYIAGNAVIFIPEAVEECVFVKLYLFDGSGLEQYFEKVYDNLGMKIYRVRYENFPPFEVYNPNLPEEDRIK